MTIEIKNNKIISIDHDTPMTDRQVFIGNLCNVSSNILRSYCESYGPLTELSVNRDKENNVYHCFAFVTYQSSRSTCQFLANRPHFLSGEEIFVKRTLPRLTSSIPERLIVTNRLILQDHHEHDQNALRIYFQKFGHIKRFHYDQGFIDFDDYDDVDRVLIARPHYIEDKEISVTKYIPSEQQDSPSRSSNNSHHRPPVHHHHRSTKNNDDQNANNLSFDSIKMSRTRKLTQNSSKMKPIQQEIEEEEDESLDRSNESDKDFRYQQLEERFQDYQQKKESEIGALKIDLERTKRQLNDLIQEKLDLLIKNQQVYHQDLLGRLCHEEITNFPRPTEDFLQSTPNKLAKKRKLTTSSNIDREFDYYS